MSTTTVTEEEALWLYIGELPDCRDRRGQVADWYDDRAGVVGCERCGGSRFVPVCSAFMYSCSENGRDCECGTFGDCPACDGTGTVSNGNAEMAEALRETNKLWPIEGSRCGGMVGSWYWSKIPHWGEPGCEFVPGDVFNRLTEFVGNRDRYNLRYPTAEAAIRDLCRAWVRSTRG